MTDIIRYIKMHLKLLFILIGASGASYTSYGQGGFSRLYLEGSGTANILYDHPHIITASQTSDTNFTRGILFMKLNTNGDTLLTRTFFNNSRNTHPGLQNSLIKTGVNEYILVGRQSPQAYIMRLDTNFNILDTTFFQFSGERTSAISVTQAANTDLLVTGTVYWLDTIRQERRKGFLAARFDAQLNLKWIKRFHTPSVNGKTVEQQAHNIIEDSQDNIWMGGYRQAIGEDNSADILVIALDSLGNKFFEQTYGDTTLDEGIATVIETADSNYLVVGGNGVNSVTIGGEVHSYIKPLVIKIDLSGTIIWNKTYGPIKAMSYPVSIDRSGKDYIIAGQYQSWPLDSSNNREGAYRSYALKIRANGDSVWYREYAPGPLFWDYNRFFDMATTLDGGLVAGGHFQSDVSPLTGSAGSHVWIVRTDSMGCVVQGCQYISTEEPIELAGITVYPNPARTYFKLQGVSGATATVKVYDANGREVLYLPEVQNQQAAPLNDLPKGLYLVQVLQKEQVIHSQKLMVQP
ncbi:MAG: T9SS type A sorting domain-containing protein [Owenweeksia sp.]